MKKTLFALTLAGCVLLCGCGSKPAPVEEQEPYDAGIQFVDEFVDESESLEPMEPVEVIPAELSGEYVIPGTERVIKTPGDPFVEEDLGSTRLFTVGDAYWIAITNLPVSEDGVNDLHIDLANGMHEMMANLAEKYAFGGYTSIQNPASLPTGEDAIQIQGSLDLQLEPENEDDNLQYRQVYGIGCVAEIDGVPVLIYGSVMDELQDDAMVSEVARLVYDMAFGIDETGEAEEAAESEDAEAAAEGEEIPAEEATAEEIPAEESGEAEENND